MPEQTTHNPEDAPSPHTDASEQKQGIGAFLLEIVKFVIIAVLVVIPIRLYIAQPFIVNGSSMDPSFATGQYLIIDELSYHFSTPKRFEVVVFSFPQDRRKFFIKRIIGLPGETVTIAGKAITVTNASHPEGLMLQEPYLDPANIRDGAWSVTLGDKQYFVMGDNRAASFDSRDWGPLPEDLIVGRAFIRLLPLQTISVFPGSVKSENTEKIL